MEQNSDAVGLVETAFAQHETVSLCQQQFAVLCHAVPGCAVTFAVTFGVPQAIGLQLEVTSAAELS